MIVRFLRREWEARRVGMALDPISETPRVTLPETLAADDLEFLELADQVERRSHWRHFIGGTYVWEYERVHSAFSIVEMGEEGRYAQVRSVLDEFAFWSKGHVRDERVAFFAVMHPANRAISREQLALDLFMWAMELGPLQT
jgi:hypothetical protein